ncbi:MAG: shikimate kinase [Planctomycetota bacterium]
MPRITLVGYRGTGKSSVAARLAARLGCPWTDADDVLELELGATIAAVIRDRGEPFFRDREAELLARLLDREAGVLATGGGVVLRPENRTLLTSRGRPVVWLQAPAAVLRERLAADPTTSARRPALGGGDALAEVAAAVVAREPLYRSVADAVVDAAVDSPDRIAARLGAWLATWRPGPPAEIPETIP